MRRFYLYRACRKGGEYGIGFAVYGYHVQVFARRHRNAVGRTTVRNHPRSLFGGLFGLVVFHVIGNGHAHFLGDLVHYFKIVNQYGGFSSKTNRIKTEVGYLFYVKTGGRRRQIGQGDFNVIPSAFQSQRFQISGIYANAFFSPPSTGTHRGDVDAAVAMLEEIGVGYVQIKLQMGGAGKIEACRLIEVVHHLGGNGLLNTPRTFGFFGGIHLIASFPSRHRVAIAQGLIGGSQRSGHGRKSRFRRHQLGKVGHQCFLGIGQSVIGTASIRNGQTAVRIDRANGINCPNGSVCRYLVGLL